MANWSRPFDEFPCPTATDWSPVRTPAITSEALIGGKGIGRAYVTASEFAKAWPNPKTLIFKLIGCIDYSFSSNGRHGQTGFAFIISRKVPNELGHETGFIPGKEAIPPEQIVFRPDPFSGGYVK